MQVEKSMGPGEMHLPLLKKLVDEMVKPLSIIFVKLWQYGEVPTACKSGNITLIFKKRKKKKVDVGNYRPA